MKGTRCPNRPLLNRALWVAAGQRSHGSILDELGGDAQMIYDRILEAKAQYRAAGG